MQKDREREAASEIERKSGFRVVEPGSAASGSSAPRAPGVSVEEQQQFQSVCNLNSNCHFRSPKVWIGGG